MPYAIQPLPFKPSRLDGLSERLLVSHYENNYGGAVRRLNAIERRVQHIEWQAAPVFEINGLKREELIATNSMILHEIYFEGLGGSGGDPGGDLAEALERDFGSISEWRAEFTAMGKAQAGGSGWVLLTCSASDGRLSNQWAADHAHCLAGGTPVLALDMYEHAYHIDFGAKAGLYVDAMMNNLHWERIGTRYAATAARQMQSPATPSGMPADALITPEALKSMLDAGEKVLVLDVCLAEDLAKRTDMVPTADLRAPEKIDEWARELPHDQPVIVYCLYGFQVSGEPVTDLRRRGVDARLLSGGIAAWHAIGGQTVPLAL
jgi:Fe-Mn family superoxide dismutase